MCHATCVAKCVVYSAAKYPGQTAFDVGDKLKGFICKKCDNAMKGQVHCVACQCSKQHGETIQFDRGK